MTPVTVVVVEFAELQVAQLMADRLLGRVGDPVLAALLLGKTAEAAERGTELVVDGDLGALDLPPRDLVTVVGNLVDNALDAVADADPRRVRVTASHEGTDAVRIVVEDSGPGLTAEEARTALERGWSTKAAPGTGRGLGLALVRQVARRHDGEVSVGRSDLGGARFDVTLAAGGGS